MSNSPNPSAPPERPGPQAESGTLGTLYRTGPVIGGVVLGMGLTILPVALDRADLPSPIPASLSWHQPDRVDSARIGRHRAHRYADLEVDLVERALADDTAPAERARIFDYLAVRAADADLRAWAASQTVEVAPAIEVEPIDWANELVVEAVPAAMEPEVVPDVTTEPVPPTGFDFLGMWRDADASAIVAVVAPPVEVEADTEAAVAVAPAPAPETAPEPVAPVIEDAVADVEPPRGPMQPFAADNHVFVDLEEGDGDLLASAVSGRVGQLVQCYESTLEFDPELTGHLEVEWHVAHGRVNAIQVGDESLGDEITLRCMTERIRRWRFEPDVTGMVAWRFAFDSHPG